MARPKKPTDELKDQRVPIMMSEDELTAIDDWSFKNRIRSRGEAIRRLCQIGLAFDEKASPIMEQTKEILRRRTNDSKKLNELEANIEPGSRGFKTFALGATRNALRALEDHARLFLGLGGLIFPLAQMKEEEDIKAALDLAEEARKDLELLLNDLDEMKVDT